MTKRFFMHGFIAACLLFSLSATESFARSRYQVDYQVSYNGYSNQRNGSGYSGGYRGYGDYDYRDGYRDGRRFQRRWQGNYRRSSYYGNYGRRYCPTPRRYRNRRRW